MHHLHEEDEKKHIRTLGHYLEKYHNTTGYTNKEVADLLNLDRSYYNKIRIGKYSPITTGIMTLKKFASLTNENILTFLQEIEEISVEQKDKDNQWIDILKSFFIESGPLLRRALIHKRIKNIQTKDEKHHKIKLTKIFTICALLIDISKQDEWLDLIFDFVLKLHSEMNLEKEADIETILKMIKLVKTKT